MVETNAFRCLPEPMRQPFTGTWLFVVHWQHHGAQDLLAQDLVVHCRPQGRHHRQLNSELLQPTMPRLTSRASKKKR